MFDRIKNAFSKAFNGSQEEIDRITNLPITQLRIDLKQAFQRKHFPKEQYEDFVERLSKINPDVEDQLELVRQAVENREVSDELETKINLSSVGRQLLWCAALTRLMQTGEEPVECSKVWKQLLNTTSAHNQDILFSKMVSSSMQNDNVTFDWGLPGTWFYFNPKKNYINRDFYFSLLMGFEHVVSVDLHEQGHSELSLTYTPRMQEIYKDIEKYIDPSMVQSTDNGNSPPPKMTIEEQKEIAGKVAEWQMRFMLWHMSEDNCVDQFSKNQEYRADNFYRQDFGYSMNFAAVILRGFGDMIRGDDLKVPVEITSDAPSSDTDKKKSIFDVIGKKMREWSIKEQIKFNTRPLDPGEIAQANSKKIPPKIAQKIMHEINWTIIHGFYVRNGLFTDKKENWERLRIYENDINETVDVSKVPEAKGMTAFQYLVHLAAGDNGPHSMQPEPKDRFFGPNHYKNCVAETSVKRNALTDHIWEVYSKKFADALIEEYKNQTEQNLKNGQSKNPNQGQGQGQGQSQPGQQQPGDGQQSESQGQPSSGGGSQQQQKNGGGGNNDPVDMDKNLQDQLSDMAKDPKEKSQKEADQKKEAGGDGQDKKDEPKQDKEAPGGKGWNRDPSQQQQRQPKKASDLKNEAPVDENRQPSKEEQDKMKEQAKELPKPGSMSVAQAGQGRGVDLANLAKGDWKDFHRRTLELAPVIAQVTRAFQKIRDEQRRKITTRAKTHEFLPGDGDIQDRFDRDKHLETKFRVAAREKMEVSDFKKFHDDKTTDMRSTIEMTFMIDGSGSMPMVGLGKNARGETVTAMDVALQSAVIGYMAARQAGIDAYIVMWGDPQPLILAKPDSNLKQVGELIETLRQGTGSGTSLAPGMAETIKTMADHKNKNGTISGTSHMLVFSDGDIADSTATEDALRTIAKNSKNISIDVAVLKPDGSSKTSMEEVFEGAISGSKSKMLGVVRGSDPAVIPLEMAKLMLKRVRNFEVKVEPDTEKRRRLKALHQKLTK